MRTITGRLSGKKAIITGGSKGIGEAIALAYAKEGADVAITYCSDEASAQSVFAKMKEFDGKYKAIKFDLQVPDEVELLMKQTVNFLGSIDILVNNAVLLTKKHFCHFLETAETDLQASIDANLIAPMRLSREVCKQMIAQKSGGAIINISAVSDKRPEANTQTLIYEVAKAGITMFTRSLAVGMAQYGIRVNTLSPGLVDTPLLRRVVPKEDLEKVYVHTPLGKMGTPEDFQEPAVLLASNTYMTGSRIVIDGGRSVAPPPSQEAFEKAKNFWIN
jgi:NAD(P)-dependent dehydrogenase (short-subunit alcohol dehydrogenase family)